jgi:LacI family transcriptional regulator
MAWRKPLVGVVVDSTMAFGRMVLQGVMQYANVRRRWLFQDELRARGGRLDHWRDCDGAILAIITPEIVQQVSKHSRFVVSCSSTSDPQTMFTVCGDDEAMGRTAAEHLMDCRLENFGFYSAFPAPLSGRRLKGFREALAARGFTCSEPQFLRAERDDWVNRRHWPRVTRWLQELPKPVGVMAVDDAMARELAAICFQAGIAVPDRVAIIGVNNDELLCNVTWPPLSSVEVDFRRVGELGAKLLDRLLSGEKLTPRQCGMLVPPVGVVKRASTDVLAVNDVNLSESVRFIREHACDPCSVQDVLRHVPVGRRWLERQFIQQLGRTPHDEIRHVQMEAARRLLLHTNLTLPEIARQSGFSAVQSFTRAFRAGMGDTPAAYRRAHAIRR